MGIVIEEVVTIPQRHICSWKAFLHITKAIEVVMHFNKETKLHVLEVKIYTEWKIETKRFNNMMLNTKSVEEDEKGSFILIKFESKN